MTPFGSWAPKPEPDEADNDTRRRPGRHGLIDARRGGCYGQFEAQRMSSCLFCRIISGEIPARIVHEDERYVAFHDVNPQAPVHILIIPKRHIEGLNDLETGDESLVGGVPVLARDLARENGLLDTGYRLVANSGPDAGQSVFHLHFHLLGGRGMSWPPG